MLSALVVRPRRPSAQKLDWRTDPNPLLELLAGDLDTGRRNNELVVALLDDIAVYLFGDLPQFVDYLFDRSVFGAVACDIGDNEIAVVDGVLDRNHVLSTRDLGDADGGSRATGGGLEAVQIQLDVILGVSLVAAAENLTHDTHTHY